MAYTKYSLTPANNTAAPPDGAPEGMLPSAVNDTMRDMMAQIRDCGDGIRDGTYTMTAPKITGGTITGSTINNSAIGGTTAAAGKFTTLEATGVATFSAGAVGTPAITTTGDTNTGIFFPAADTIAFTEGGVEAMRIDSSGNVGIGATSPNGRLEVVSTSAGANTNTLFLTNASSNASTSTSLVFGVSTAPTIRNATIQAINAGSNAINLAFLTSDGDVPAERMRITSAGNVGIGTTSPATRLDVRCVSDVTQDIAYFSRPDAAVRAKIALDGSGIINFGTSTNHPLAFLTNNTERMRILSSGEVQIGTTNITNGGFSFEAGYNGAGKSAALFGHITGTGSGNQYCIFYYDGTIIGSITQNGTTAVAYNTTSDYRLKENIAPMTNALAKVAQLKPVTYTWKSDGLDGQGFIAHELQAVVPDAVTGEKDAVDKDGKPTYQGVDTSYLVATLTAAIQEQQAMIEELKQEVAKLKGN